MRSVLAQTASQASEPPAEPGTTAAPTFVASLMLVSADWSTAPEAKQIEADLRAALGGDSVSAGLLEKLPQSATAILFPPQAASIYSQQRYAQLLAWLTAKKLIVRVERFWSPNAPPGQDHGPASRLLMEQDDASLGLSAPGRSPDLFFTQTSKYMWGIASDAYDDRWWVSRERHHYEQARGEEAAKRIRTNEYDRCEFTFPPLEVGQVLIVPAFPEVPTAVWSRAAVPFPRAVLIIERRGTQTTTAAAEPRFVLPDKVERIEAERMRGSSFRGSEDFSWRPSLSGRTDRFRAARDSSAAPPVDPAAPPAEPHPRQVTDGKIIIAWSEAKDIAWGFSTAVGKWARQEINPPAGEAEWPIVGDGTAVWQVGSAYYGFSGKTAKWDVLRLPEGHSPKPILFPDHAVVTDGSDIYTFADATGRWSSTKEDGVSEPAADDWQIKVFSLVNARAADAERIVRQLFGRAADSLSADERTNSIIVAGRPGMLEIIHALLVRLDEPLPAEAVGGVKGTARFPAQPAATASAADLTKQYEAKERQAAEIAREIRKMQAGVPSIQGPAETLTADLRRIVGEAFAARQQLQQAELTALRERMQRIEQTIASRGRIAEQIIEHRVKELLDPNLQWEQPADTGSRLPGAASTPPSAQDIPSGGQRPRVVGAAFGEEADRICEALGLTVHRLKKDEITEQRLLGCLRIDAISPDSPASELQVGDIITMMQMQTTPFPGTLGRRVTMSVQRGSERIPVTVEFPLSPPASSLHSGTPGVSSGGS